MDMDPAYKTGLGALPPFTIRRWAIRPFRMVGGLRPRVDQSGVDIVDTTTPSGGRVRVYLPAGTDGPVPVLLWIHGGGLIGGDHRDDAWGCHFARTTGVAVASAAYRLAPEHPFPAALDDLTDAMAWVRSGGNGRFDPERVMVGGESAGGGLAAALCQRLHDTGAAPNAQLLVYPMLDDRTAVRADYERNQHPVWTKGSNHTGWSAYLGSEPGAASTPEYAVPARRDDLAGLPPAWIGVGTADLFHDENVDYAGRLEAAGVPCELVIFDGAPHGFPSVAPKAEGSQALLASAATFVASILT